MRLPSWGVALALAVAGACAIGTAGTSESRPSARSDNSVITADELKGSAESNLFDLVRARRPTWFNSKPTTIHPDLETGIVVYLDNTRLGGVDVLRQFAPGSVMAVRFYNPSSAQARFGPGHLNGAIQLSSGRRVK